MRTWPEQREYERSLHHTERDDARRAWLVQFEGHFTRTKDCAACVSPAHAALRKMSLRLGVELPKGRTGGTPWIPVDKIRDMAGQGFTAREIADEIGCSACRVRNLAATHGIKIKLQRNPVKRAAVERAETPPQDAKPEERPRPLTMADYAARENAAMRRTGLR